MENIPDSQSASKLKVNRKNTGKRYNHLEKLSVAALLKAGKSKAEISRETGVNPATIYNVEKDKKYTILEASKVDDIKRSLVGMTYAQAHRAQEFISDEKLQNSSALQLMTISAIGIDKGRLMEGLSTEIVGQQKDECELDREIIRKREELDRIRNAKIIDVSDDNAKNIA